MFDSDKWIEIFATMAKNPLRTFLTGLSVSLGVFILVVLQGLGFGLQNGVFSEFDDDAINSLWIRSGRTSKPHGGFQPNRRIQYKENDLDFILETYPEANIYSGRYGFWGAPITFRTETQNFAVRSVHPGHQDLEKTKLTGGRFINELDLKDERKVCIIGQQIIDDLFKGVAPIDKYIKVYGIPFRIVGTYNDPASRWENRVVYLPISTGQKVFGGGDNLDMFILTTGTKSFDETVEMRQNIEKLLRERHKVHPEDERAIRVRNVNEDLKEYLDIFRGIKIFIWVMGILTLIAGMIGVANIMSVVVKERTKEFGIRKAIGASPGSIVSMILQEAVLLTLVSGCLGLLSGIGALNLISTFVEHDYFQNPKIDVAVSVGVIIVLMFIGALAGLFPSIRASRIKPITALRED